MQILKTAWKESKNQKTETVIFQQKEIFNFLIKAQKRPLTWCTTQLISIKLSGDQVAEKKEELFSGRKNKTYLARSYKNKILNDKHWMSKAIPKRSTNWLDFLATWKTCQFNFCRLFCLIFFLFIKFYSS